MNTSNKISKQRRFSLRKAEKFLDRSCDQMDVLQRQIQNLERRQTRAKANNNSAIQQSIKIELQMLRGVYAMFYEYAEEVTEKMAKAYQERRQVAPVTEGLLTDMM